MSFAEKLTALRKGKGITQMELAERLNVSRQAVSRWEVGAAIPSTDNLKVLSDLFDVPIDYLLNGDAIHKTEGQKEKSENCDHRPAKAGNRSFVVYVLVIIIAMAALAWALIPRNREQDQMIPMEELYTGPKENYSEGTFTFE